MWIFIKKQKHKRDKNFLDKIIVFQLDYRMLIKTLDKFLLFWSLQTLTQHKTCSLNYNSKMVKQKKLNPIISI